MYNAIINHPPRATHLAIISCIGVAYTMHTCANTRARGTNAISYPRAREAYSLSCLSCSRGSLQQCRTIHQSLPFSIQTSYFISNQAFSFDAHRRIQQPSAIGSVAVSAYSLSFLIVSSIGQLISIPSRSY